VLPRHRSVPAAPTSAGVEAVELAASAGLILDDWQAATLVDALGERSDGKWSAFEVGVVVPRQNGKGAILEARELAGLFLFDERLILHSAHEFKTAAEAFRRVLYLVQSTPDLDRRVSKVRTSHGDEGIELKGGQRLRFVARSTGSGRGFSGDCVILDEAYNLSTDAMAALLPTMAARPNPQLWYTSSAPLPLPVSDVLRRLCRRGRAGTSESLAYLEWCADPDLAPDDPEAWQQANPSLGVRMSPEFVLREMEALDPEGFARERLGVWIDDDEMRARIVVPADWHAGADPKSQIAGRFSFGFAVSVDRSRAAVSVAGRRADGRPHIECVRADKGTAWVVPFLRERRAKWGDATFVCDAKGPAGALLAECDREGVPVRHVSLSEYQQACGALLDDIVERRLRHLGQPELDAAVDGAGRRDVGDAWLWSRTKSSADITPLEAATVAKFDADQHTPVVVPMVAWR